VDRSRAESLAAIWVIGLLGAEVGLGLSFTLRALRLDAEHGPFLNHFSDDFPLWMLVTIATAAGAAAVTLGLPVRASTSVTAALTGAFTAAVLPTDYRSPGRLSNWSLGVMLVSPVVLIAAVLFVNWLRFRREPG
jgi:hypothetical protein